MSSRCHEFGSKTETEYICQRSISIKQCWNFIQLDMAIGLNKRAAIVSAL
jgi:hypothetical protein